MRWKKTVKAGALFLSVLCMGLICSSGMSLIGNRGMPAGRNGEMEAETITILTEENSAHGLSVVATALALKYGVKAQIITRPSSNEGESMVRTRLAAGEMADIFVYHTGSLMHALSPATTILPITDESLKSRILPEYKEANTIDGQLYGVPLSSAFSYVWAYNKSIYARLGLKVPDTWAALMENCEIIANNGTVPVLASYRSSWSEQIVLLSDLYNVKALMPEYVDEYNAGRAPYATTPAALRSFEKLADMGNYLNEDYMTAGRDEMLERLLRGDGAHYPMNSTLLNVIRKQYPDLADNIGIFAQPGDIPGNNGFTLWMPFSLYVYRNSPNADLAMEWLSLFASQYGQSIYATAVSPGGPYVIDGIDLPPNVPEGIREIQAALNDGKTTVALEFVSPLKGPNCANICFETITGIRTPLEAAMAYDLDIEKQSTQFPAE